MIDLEHSPLGGSGAHRFMTCFGSFLLHREQLQNGTFEDVESEYAVLGTAAHELCATSLIEQREPFEYLGEKFGNYIAGWPEGLSLDAAHVYFTECMTILDRRQERGTVLIEQTIHLPEIHPLLRGTVDFGFWSRKDGVKLRDYKNGEGVGVSAPNNRQLLYYGFIMVMSDHWLRAADRSMPVSLGIVQPNFYGVFEAPDVWETTLGHVLDWGYDELLPTMNTLMSRGAPELSDFVTGSHCQFCPVMLDCPKMQKAFHEYAEASEDFIAMLTNEELDRYYADRENVRRFMSALETTVHARLVAGGSIPSAKLVEKKTRRVWKPGAHAALAAALGENAYEPKSIKSPAQIEKLSSMGKSLALEWGYKPESAGLSVAPLSDPRPEAKPRTNATTFANFEQSPEDLGF